MAGGQGCIIVRESDDIIVWRERCDSCGYVGSNSHHSTNPGPGAILTSGFYCSSCRKQQDVRIFG